MTEDFGNSSALCLNIIVMINPAGGRTNCLSIHRKKYTRSEEGDHLSLKNYGDDIILNRDTAVATVQITVSRKCITQEEMDELYALSERLKEKCAGN
ncbi:hypothetical protein ACLB1R_00540 [Escherichia coli]